MDHLHYEHCLAFVTALEQDEFFLKIHAQIPSDAGVSGRELASRIEQISGHLRRVKGCDSVSHGQLAFARTEDSFHRARALTDGVDGRVLVKFIDYGHEEWILLQDFIIVDPPLSDVLTTVRPLADEFLLDGIIFQRPLSSEEIVQLSEKILFQALSSRIRRVNPDVALIELATPNNAGGRPENLRNLIYEAGYGKKVSVEDIAKYLRIKPSSRPEEIAAANMQPGSRQPPYSTPPPNMMIPPPQNIGSPTILTAASSVNTRLTRFKKDSGSEWNGTGPLPGYQHLAMTPPLADRKQYADGRLCTTAPTLPVNSTHNAYISHVEDGPYLFYVQLKASVEQVLPKLKNILARNQCVPVNAQLIPGSVVVAKSSDDTLRRGVVMNLTSGSCKIYYIDFGHLEDRPLSDLYNLPNTAADLSPAMAIQFCLADLGGVKVTDGNKDYFSRLLLGKQVFLRVTEKESNSPFQFCDIIWEGRSVREILVNLNSPMQYQYQLAPSSRETSVSVIYADSPNQFYVQYRSELSVIGQIQEALAAHCKSQPRIADVGVNSIGSPVAAIFPEDETWYRALIMGMDSNKINVFYVDYGNRAEVTSNQICALTRDLVNKWKAQAVECCLVGFDSATPDNFMAGKMEETVLGNTYSLRLHSILSGFRLNVDLIDEQGNSVASKMKAILEERQKALPYTSTHSPPKKAMSPEEDKLSQHSSDGGGSGKKNKFPRPPLRSDREKERGSKFEQRTERTKVEDRQSPFHQHDDRSGGSLKADSTQKEDIRGEWKKSAKKPHMDQESGWGSTGSKPENGSWNDKQDSGTGPKKSDWRSSDGASKGRFNSDRGDKGEWSDRGTSRDGDRKGGFNNRFERKPSNNDEDSWGSKDRKFAARGERDGKFGDKDNRSGDWSNKFGDRDKKFGDRGNRFGDRDKFNGERGSKFGGRDKPSFRDNQKPRWNNDDSQASGKTQIAENNDDWDDELTTPVVHAPSVAISEYPHQRIIVGQEYQVLFVGMETPHKVYVQISGCDPVLEKIRGIIDADVGASSRPLMPTRIALGMPVLARFLEDGLLYRAMVKSVKYSAAEVDVLFVDYGNSASIPVGEVYTISSEAMDVPVQAIHVEISDIPDNIPVDVATSQAYFEEVDYFILKPSSVCVINLAQAVTGTLIRSDGISIADRLRTCFEMNTDPAQQAQVKTNIPSAEVNPDPVQSSTSAPTQEAVAEPSNKDIPEVNTVVSPKPDHWIERLDFLVGQTLRAVVTAVAEDSYLIKIPDALDLTVLARSEQCISHEVKSGTEVIVKVNALADDRLSADFYNRGGESLSGGPGVSPICPMPIVSRKGMYNVSHKEGEMLYLHPTDSIEQLSGFLEVLYNKYESSSLTANDTFVLDDFCVAKSPLDENWYRARITNVEGSTLTVYYVDYGNSERVNRENVRKLEQPFFEPAMCVGVSLPLKYNDVVEGMPKVFDSLEDPLECTFIKKGSSAWIVDLCKADTNENFALKWIAANQAVSVGPISANPKKREPGWNLKKHDVIKVVLSHADSPNSFFVQLKKDIVDIDELQSKLTLLPEDGDLGEVFAAKYLADNAWYRAVSVGDQVRFIDYGNTDFATERKKLTDDLIHPIGGYAMPLVIKIKPKGDDWTEEAASAFDEFSEGELTAEIISVDFETVVDLLRGTKSLTRCLVDGGHAVLTDVQQKSVEAVGTNDLPVQSVPLPPVISKSFYKNCVFCHSNGPYDFYLQTDDDRISVEEMENALFGPGAFPSLNEVKKGDFVVAQFSEDDAYYRAVVTEDQPEVVVNFIDYGNSCPATVFHQLPDKLKDIPSLAIRCSLQSPMGGWSVDAIDKFSEFLNPQSKSIDLKIITKGDPNIVDVEINGASVTKLLAPDAKFEQNDDPVVAPIAVEESSRVQEVDEQVAVVAELQTKLVLSESEESKPESSSIITIPYAVSPSEFYCKEVAEEEKIMSESLSSADKFAPIEKYEVGQLVCAQFPDDELWYRARVESLEPTTVFFVDFGNDSEVTNVRALPDDLSKIPPLCFKASLTPQVQPWTEEETDKFLSVAVVGEFNCTIVERTPDLAVVQLSSADKSDMITFLGRGIIVDAHKENEALPSDHPLSSNIDVVSVSIEKDELSVEVITAKFLSAEASSSYIPVPTVVVENTSGGTQPLESTETETSSELAAMRFDSKKEDTTKQHFKPLNLATTVKSAVETWKVTDGSGEPLSTESSQGLLAGEETEAIESSLPDGGACTDAKSIVAEKCDSSRKDRSRSPSPSRLGAFAGRMLSPVRLAAAGVSKVGAAASGVTSGVGTVASGVVTMVGTAATGVATGVGSAVVGVTSGVETAASGVASKVGTVGSGVANRAEVVAYGLGAVAGAVATHFLNGMSDGSGFPYGIQITGNPDVDARLAMGIAELIGSASRSLSRSNLSVSGDSLVSGQPSIGHSYLSDVTSAAGDLASSSALNTLSAHSNGTSSVSKCLPRSVSAEVLSRGPHENEDFTTRQSLDTVIHMVSDPSNFDETPPILVPAKTEAQLTSTPANLSLNKLPHHDKSASSVKKVTGKAKPTSAETHKRNETSAIEASKKQPRPVKSLAEIKANAKSRIFSSSCTKLKNPSVQKKIDENKPSHSTPPKTPFLEEKTKTKSTPTSHSSPSCPRETKQDLKILPGSVSGYV